MSTEFENITEQYVDDAYIYVNTDELTLKILPFYSLPARKIVTLYSKKHNQQKFLKEVYSLIHIAMKEPSNFKALVYDAGITYTGLIQFVNTWINISSMIHKHENGEMVDGVVSNRERVTNVDIVENIVNSRLAKGEEVKDKLLIRYLSEHIRETAYNHNQHCKPDDIITEVVITIPIGDNLE